MNFTLIKSRIINCSITGDLRWILGINSDDIFTIALELDLWNILEFLKFHKVEISGVSFHFRQSLIEECEYKYKYIYDNFRSMIDLDFLKPDPFNTEDEGVIPLINNREILYLNSIGIEY